MQESTTLQRPQPSFFAQLSEESLSQILYVWVKIKSAYFVTKSVSPQKCVFATKLDFRTKNAHFSNLSALIHNHHWHHCYCHRHHHCLLNYCHSHHHHFNQSKCKFIRKSMHHIYNNYLTSHICHPANPLNDVEKFISDVYRWIFQMPCCFLLRFVSFRMKNAYWSDADTVHDIQIQMQSDDQCLYFIINYEWQFRRMDPNTKLRLKQCNHPVYMKLCLYAKIHIITTHNMITDTERLK